MGQSPEVKSGTNKSFRCRNKVEVLHFLAAKIQFYVHQLSTSGDHPLRKDL